MELNGNRIRTITSRGAAYLDANESEQFIDFQHCYNNYLAHNLSDSTWQKVKELNNLTDNGWEQYAQSVISFREVGTRNSMSPPWGNGPFVEFYTTPPIRFLFDTLDEWREVRDSVRRAGWLTFDLS